MENPRRLAIITIGLWSFGAYLARLISIRSQFFMLSFSFLFTFITIIIYTYLSQRRSLITLLKSIRLSFLLVGPFGYFIYWLGLVQSSRNFNRISETTILNYS